jgi:hypothetical protein
MPGKTVVIKEPPWPTGNTKLGSENPPDKNDSTADPTKPTIR